jgi:hypothetical protein
MTRMPLVVAAGFTLMAGAAHAGPCTYEIAMVSELLGNSVIGNPMPIGLQPVAAALPAPFPKAPEDMVTAAGNAEVLEHVEMAKQADAEGNEATCMDQIGEAKMLLGWPE